MWTLNLRKYLPGAEANSPMTLQTNGWWKRELKTIPSGILLYKSAFLIESEI